MYPVPYILLLRDPLQSTSLYTTTRLYTFCCLCNFNLFFVCFWLGLSFMISQDSLHIINPNSNAPSQCPSTPPDVGGMVGRRLLPHPHPLSHACMDGQWPPSSSQHTPWLAAQSAQPSPSNTPLESARRSLTKHGDANQVSVRTHCPRERDLPLLTGRGLWTLPGS